jgi:hypothetical protein
MAASDNLNPGLFHGTTAWLKPGDVIEPRTRDDFYGPEARDERGYLAPHTEHTAIGAYASPEVDIAKQFAKQRMNTEAEQAGVTKTYTRNEAGEWGITEGMRPGSPSYQPALFAPVYSVEHVTEHSDPEGRISARGRNHRRDTSGFKVTGITDYAMHDDKAWEG